MKNNIILFGCSHTANSLHESFYGSDKLVNKSFVGNSNQKIFNDVYKYVNSDEYSIDDILIIQYTYTNRLWWPHKMGGREFSFHSFDIKNSGIYRCNKFASKELLEMYSTYIKYFWNYDTAFETHKMNIDLLKSYLDQNKVKYLHWMYTDGGNTQEWDGGFDKFWETKDMNDVFSKLNLFHINGEYRIGDWANKNGFIDDSDHINRRGNYILAQQMCKTLIEEFDCHIKAVESFDEDDTRSHGNLI